MDARILFPEISLFVSNKIGSSNLKSRDPARKISKARHRKNRLMKLKTMASSSFKQPVGDDSFLLLDFNGVEEQLPPLAGGGDGSPVLSSPPACSVEPPPPLNFDFSITESSRILSDGLAQPKVVPLKIKKKASSSSQGVYDLRPHRK